MPTLRQLAAALNAPCPEAEEFPLTHVSGIAHANAQAVVFAEDAASLALALASQAGAVLTTPALAASASGAPKPLLPVERPRLAFARAARLLQRPLPVTGVHPTAIVGQGARLGKDVSIGPYAVLGDQVRVGDRTRIDAGVVIGESVRIGADCHIYPRVVVYAGTALGDRVVLHAGCVLGADGFGYVLDPGTGAYTQFPQQGTLVLEDDVEIGANSTVDRGALEETRIAHGTKLDNLVHIGHNVQVGSNVVMASLTGISGSSTVGDGAVLGGQVGVGEHAEIGPQAILGGGAGVLSKKKLHGPGVVFWGRPAQPLREHLRGLATLARLARKGKNKET